MSELLVIIILVCGFIALTQAVNSLSENPSAFIPVTIILGIMYAFLVGGIWFIYVAFGRNRLVIYGALAFIVILMLGLFIRLLLRNSRHINAGHLVVFILYFGAVLYLTLFSRKVGSDKSLESDAFRGLELAMSMHSLEPLRHSLLNLALFLPFGYLIPSINRACFGKWGFAVIGGVITSTVIEGIQMIAQLGQCDIDDIIFNSIGAALGYIFFVFMRRVRRNWRLF